MEEQPLVEAERAAEAPEGAGAAMSPDVSRRIKMTRKFTQLREGMNGEPQVPQEPQEPQGQQTAAEPGQAPAPADARAGRRLLDDGSQPLP